MRRILEGIREKADTMKKRLKRKENRKKDGKNGERHHRETDKMGRKSREGRANKDENVGYSPQ